MGLGALTGLLGLTDPGNLADLEDLVGSEDPDWRLGPVGPGALVDFGPKGPFEQG